MIQETFSCVSARPPTSTPRSCSPTRLRAVPANDPKTKAVETRTWGSGDVLGDRLAEGRIQLGAQRASRVTS
jgi:hypothetical protein